MALLPPGNWPFAESSWPLAAEEPRNSELEGCKLTGHAIGPRKASKLQPKDFQERGKTLFPREKAFCRREKPFCRRIEAKSGAKRVSPAFIEVNLARRTSRLEHARSGASGSSTTQAGRRYRRWSRPRAVPTGNAARPPSRPARCPRRLRAGSRAPSRHPAGRRLRLRARKKAGRDAGAPRNFPAPPLLEAGFVRGFNGGARRKLRNRHLPGDAAGGRGVLEYRPTGWPDGSRTRAMAPRPSGRLKGNPGGMVPPSSFALAQLAGRSVT
jgi:hypothetical protein